MMGSRLSPQMLGVLGSIASPHEDDEPFPPTHTVRALERRGLIAFERCETPQNPFEMLCGGGVVRLKVTTAGLDALEEFSPHSPPKRR